FQSSTQRRDRRKRPFRLREHWTCSPKKTDESDSRDRIASASQQPKSSLARLMTASYPVLMWNLILPFSTATFWRPIRRGQVTGSQKNGQATSTVTCMVIIYRRTNSTRTSTRDCAPG